MSIEVITSGNTTGRVLRDDPTVQEIRFELTQDQFARHVENAASLLAQIDRIGAPERARAQARHQHEGALWSEIGASLDPALWHGLHEAQETLTSTRQALEEAQRDYDSHEARRPRSIADVPTWADIGRGLERQVLSYTQLLTEARRLYQTAAETAHAAFVAAVATHAATAQQAYTVEEARHRAMVAESEQRLSAARRQVQASETLAQRLRERDIAIFEEV